MSHHSLRASKSFYGIFSTPGSLYKHSLWVFLNSPKKRDSCYCPEQISHQMFGEDQRGKALNVCLHMINWHHCRLVDTFIYVRKRFQALSVTFQITAKEALLLYHDSPRLILPITNSVILKKYKSVHNNPEKKPTTESHFW